MAMMRQKRRQLTISNVLTSSSSSDEDSENESSDESESSSEEEINDQEEDQSKQSSPVTPAVENPFFPELATPEASTESESGSNEYSNVDKKSHSASVFIIKPDSNRKSDSKQQDFKNTQTKVAGKRASETQLNNKESKAKKSRIIKNEDDHKTYEKKSGGGNRLWSEKDEIAVLDGVIRYRLEKGRSDTDLSLFPEFIKGSIRSDISKTQLNDKLKRLKRKFLPYLKKIENGEDSVIPKPHDSVLFELFKKIWNAAGKLITITVDENAKKKKILPKEDVSTVFVVVDEPNAKQANNEEDEEEKANNEEEKEVGFVYLGLEKMLKFPNMSAEESKMYFEKNLGLIGGSKAKEMNEKWKKLQIEEFEVYAKKMALLSEMSNVLLHVFKFSKN